MSIINSYILVTTATGYIFKGSANITAANPSLTFPVERFINGQKVRAKAVTIETKGRVNLILGGQTIIMPNGYSFDLRVAKETLDYTFTGDLASLVTVTFYSDELFNEYFRFKDIQNALNVETNTVESININFQDGSGATAGKLIYTALSDPRVPIGQSIETPFKIRPANMGRTFTNFLFDVTTCNMFIGNGTLIQSLKLIGYWGQSSADCNIPFQIGAQARSYFKNHFATVTVNKLIADYQARHDYVKYAAFNHQDLWQILPRGEIWIKFSPDDTLKFATGFSGYTYVGHNSPGPAANPLKVTIN